MKRVSVITLFLLLGLSIGTSHAVEVTLFGPQQYSRTKGKPNVYTDSLTISGLTGEGKLIIKNGDENGNDRVSSALIHFNGEQIFGPDDFNQQVYNLEASVNLVEDNSISIELRSKPGSYLTVRVQQEIAAEAAAVIGSEGGVVEVTDPNSPIFGAKIEIPQGALDTQLLTINKSAPVAPVPETFNAGEYINFEPDWQVFNSLITLAIPYNDKNNDGIVDGTDFEETDLSVYTYVDNSKTWQKVPIKNQDIVKNLLYIQTNHFSQYVASGNDASSYCWPVYENDNAIVYSNAPNNNYDDIVDYSAGIINALGEGILKKLVGIPSFVGIIQEIFNNIPICGEDPAKIRVGLIFDGHDTVITGAWQSFTDIPSSIAYPVISIAWGEYIEGVACCPWLQSNKIEIYERTWGGGLRYEQELFSEDEMEDIYVATNDVGGAIIVSKHEIDFCSIPEDFNFGLSDDIKVESPGVCSAREEESVLIFESGLDDLCQEGIVTINFDELPDGSPAPSWPEVIDDEYLAWGVAFSGGGDGQSPRFVSMELQPYDWPASGQYVFDGMAPFRVRLDFGSDVYGITAKVVAGTGWTARLTAYDSNNMPIAQDSGTPPQEGYSQYAGTLSVLCTVPIHHAIFKTDDEWYAGVGIEDLILYSGP